jgi:hypothetical protein
MARNDDPDSVHRAAGAAMMAGGVFGLLALGVYAFVKRPKSPTDKTGELIVHQSQKPPPSIPWHQPGWVPPPDPKTPVTPKA